MLKASISDVEILRDSVAVIAELIDEGIFKFLKDKVELVATDRAMVAAVFFQLYSNAFDIYEVEKEVNVGLNLSNFLSVLKRAKARDRINLNLKDSKFEIGIENSSRRRFTLPLIEIAEEEMPNLEQLKFSVSAEISTEVLKSGISDAELVADNVIFETSPSSFIMKAEGDISQAELQIEKGEESLISLNTEKNVKARYPIDYLKKIIKASKVAEIVKIEFGDDYPMKLTFDAENKARISFVLAPRTS